MRTIATIQYKNEMEARHAANTMTIEQIVAQMETKLPSGTYLYVNESNQIEAASVWRDAAPADEVEFIGRTR